jgi:hypothetical protein
MKMHQHLFWISIPFVVCLLLAGGAAVSPAAEGERQVWTDPEDPTLPESFQLQGEYVGEIADGAKLGCQVIALGRDSFHAVVYPGGLPGDGWDGENKILLDGRLDDQRAVFKPAEGDRQYLAQSQENFSATRQFPPAGHKAYTATIDGQAMTGETDDGRSFELKKTVRKSPSVGAEPPAEAIVLFDGSDKDAWRGGRLDEQTGLLNTDGHDILSVEKFDDYVLHLEFMLPFRPAARGQGRGNSGLYLADHYEVQILDSFGLEGLHNECGGVYTKAAPSVNMCFPPLTWQTYEAHFTNAVRDEAGNKVSNAVLTLKMNGVVVHDQVEIDGPTGGHRPDPEGTPGPIKLQGHGNPLQFRNIWLVPKTD